MEMRAPRTDTKPWYRQFWPWFLIGILVWAVITGITTIYLAVSTSDGLVLDDYYKQGLLINRALGRERRAEELGLEALVNMDLADHRVRVKVLSHKAPMIAPALHMQLLHPTRNHFDVTLDLEGDGGGDYSAPIPEDLAPANWHLIIEPRGREWRLHGRIELPRDMGVVLRPQT